MAFKNFEMRSSDVATKESDVEHLWEVGGQEWARPLARWSHTGD